MARFRRIQGRTVAQFSVAQDGTVSNTRIYSSENEAFKQPVLDAVKSWKFKGPIAAGEYFWTFDFKLAGQEKEAPGRLRSK
jgi:TonB family protein